MFSHAKAQQLAKGSTNKSKSSKSPTIIPPKAIHNELHMCVALRRYSAIREGKGKALNQQYALLEDFFHGKEGHSPSQIEMMAKGQLYYADLYDLSTVSITSKKHKSKKKKNTTVKYFLETSLSRDNSHQYYQGTDITVCDLEKNFVVFQFNL
jgi:hypothetical protein